MQTKEIKVELEMDEFDLTVAESKATYEEIKRLWLYPFQNGKR